MNLTKDFFLGGNATFTVQNPKGEYYTFKIRQRTPTHSFLAYLLAGPDNTNDYVYVGRVVPEENGFVKLTDKSRFTADTKPVQVIRWALKHVWMDTPLPIGYQIRHEGKCGRCGRTLTTPESLDRGIGPECWKRM